MLQSAESYIEDVPSGELKQALESGRFRPSADAGVCAGFDVAVIAAPTPLRDGLPDLTYLEDAGPHAGPVPAARGHGRPRVDLLPGNHAGDGAAAAGGGIRPDALAATSTSATAPSA